jgi:hypothetical protein
MRISSDARLVVLALISVICPDARKDTAQAAGLR